MKVVVCYTDGVKEVQFDSIDAVRNSKSTKEFEMKLLLAFMAVADQLGVRGEVERAWVELEDRRKIFLTIVG